MNRIHRELVVDAANKELEAQQQKAIKIKAKREIDTAKSFILVTIQEDVVSVIGAVRTLKDFMEMSNALSEWRAQQSKSIFNKIIGDFNDKK